MEAEKIRLTLEAELEASRINMQRIQSQPEGVSGPQLETARKIKDDEVNAPRFSAYGMNYLLIYSAPISYDEKDHSLEGQVSLRYNFDKKGIAYLHFTNRFDFYVNTRESSPVITRDEKIGLNIDFSPFSFIKNTKYFESATFGFTHWSNGQNLTVYEDGYPKNEPGIDPDNPPVHTVTPQEYLDAYEDYTNSGYNESKYVIDSLSRSRNYFELATSSEVFENTYLGLALKIPVWKDNLEETVHGPIHPDASFRNYDLGNLSLLYRNGRLLTYGQVTMGNSYLKRASYDLGIVYELGVPWLLKYHHGPMQRLSDYTREVNTLSFGIEMSL